MIPTTLHQIWLGPRGVPEHLVNYAKAWRRLHPTWRMILWTDRPEAHAECVGNPWDEVAGHPPIINRYVYHYADRWFGDRAAWAARSDILRYELVARYGGVYSDLDFEPFDNIEQLLEGVKLFNADEWGPCCGNYLFGAEPNHPAMWSAVRNMWRGVAPKLIEGRGLRGIWNRLRYRLMGKKLVTRSRFEQKPPRKEWKGILQTTGPFYLASQIHTHPDCVVFPWQLFNPLPAPFDAKKVTNWPDHSVGNHHYAGTWYDREKESPLPALMEAPE